jgi:hypothetical protein
MEPTLVSLTRAVRLRVSLMHQRQTHTHVLRLNSTMGSEKYQEPTRLVFTCHPPAFKCFQLLCSNFTLCKQKKLFGPPPVLLPVPPVKLNLTVFFVSVEALLEAQSLM